MRLPEHGVLKCRKRGIENWLGETTGVLAVPYRGKVLLIRLDCRYVIHVMVIGEYVENPIVGEVPRLVFKQELEMVSSRASVREIPERLASHMENTSATPHDVLRTWMGFCPSNVCELFSRRKKSRKLGAICEQSIEGYR